MLDREPFLKAIFADPDDDLPRLVFADYLEEQGEAAWAELIRVQCEYARRLPDPAAGVGELLRQESILLLAIREDFARRGIDFDERDYWRGFRRSRWIDLTAEELTEPEALRRKALADHPEWYGAIRLKITAGRVILPVQLSTTLTSPVTERVTELDLSGREVETVATLIESGNDSGLPVIDTELRPVVTVPMVELLAQSREARRLTELDLTNNDLDNDAARAIAGSPHLFRLRRLAFSRGNRFHGRTWQKLVERFGPDVVE